jgi:hypothetical protein
MRLLLAATLTVVVWVGPVAAQGEPMLVPLTRDEMKKALDALKKRQPRLPLPPLTEAEKEKLGGRPPANNGRMRAYYLPVELRGEFRRGGAVDPNLSLSQTLRTMFFWIVSRATNCHY